VQKAAFLLRMLRRGCAIGAHTLHLILKRHLLLLNMVLDVLLNVLLLHLLLLHLKLGWPWHGPRSPGTTRHGMCYRLGHMHAAVPT